jgi:predicted N-acyltransferase
MERMPEELHFVLARDAAGDVLAGAFNLLGKEALYGRYWGAFSEVPFLHFNVCLYEGVRECISRGLARFEPGAGGDHKEGRGFAPTITQSVHYLRQPALDAAVRDFCRREADGIRAHVAESTSQEDAE